MPDEQIDQAEWTFHPATLNFPLMNVAELTALAEDLKAHGQNEDIELLDGMVLDGRNRVLACEIAGIEPRTRALSDNTNPLDHLISKNLMRRHQTKLERALFAARLVTTRHGGDRRSERYQGEAIKTGNPGLEIVSPADAARHIGLSKDAVERAGYILEHGADEFIAAIDAGIPWLTLNYADKIAHSDEEDQRLWLFNHKHAIKPVKRATRPPRIPIPITHSVLKALNDQQALVVVEKLMPKANRALKPQGKRVVIIDLTKEEP
jgi:hypothetical protein